MQNQFNKVKWLLMMVVGFAIVSCVLPLVIVTQVFKGLHMAGRYTARVMFQGYALVYKDCMKNIKGKGDE